MHVEHFLFGLHYINRYCKQECLFLCALDFYNLPVADNSNSIVGLLGKAHFLAEGIAMLN